MHWKDEREPTTKHCLGRQVDVVQKVHHYRVLDAINGEPMEFEWIIFPRFTSLQLVDKVQQVQNKMGDPAKLEERIITMSMFNDISFGSQDNELECELSANLSF